MKRYLCALTICVILVILGLYKIGIVFFEYTGKTEGEFYATIESIAKEKKYTNMYETRIDKNKFLIYVKKSAPTLEIGDIIKFKGKYKEPSKARNEGGFDYNVYLKTKKIYGTFSVESLEKVGKNNSIYVTLKKQTSKIKEYIKNTLNKNLKTENSALLTGLLIGDKENIDNTVIDNFRDASLSHLLAISGAHFSYIILMISFINKKLKHRNLGKIISIVSILFFMNLTGQTPSIIRAGITSLMNIIACLLHRKSDIWTNLAISAILQIIYNPYVIFDMGFILSYSGVIGILIFYNIIHKKIKSPTVSVTLSANLVIMPIMMYNYNTISLSFVISNIFASFLLGPIIILGYISIICRFKFIFIILNLLLSLLQDIAKICANIPFSKIYVSTPSIISILVFYMLLACLLKKKRNKFKLIAFIVLIIFISNINFQVLNISVNGNLLINFVDVSQGDSTLIRINNKTLMIDSGGTADSDSTYDMGKSMLLPYLLNKKITRLDYIMISHFDADHSKNFISIIENIDISCIILSKQFEESSIYKQIITKAKEKKIKLIYVKAGDSLNIDKLKLTILHPQDKLMTNNAMNSNSIVCKVEYKSFSILFTGDIEKETEMLLLSKNINLKADILKVAHHGSKSSTTIEFLKAVSPKIALIGVGENNKFGHPNEGVLQRMQSMRYKNF